MNATPESQFRPQLETCEDRSLMTAGIGASYSGGVLGITGSGHGDHIHLREMGGQVTIDGFRGSVASSQLRSVQINAGGGNDVVTLDLSRLTASRVRVDAGAGCDSLVASSLAMPGWRMGFERYLN